MRIGYGVMGEIFMLLYLIGYNSTYEKRAHYHHPVGSSG